MADSIRVIYRNVQGTLRANYNWGPIHKDSAVIITAAEWAPSGGLFGITDGRPHLGDANVYVTNIGVHGDEGGGGGVEFNVHVDWGTPIDVIATITVLEAVKEVVVA